MIELGVRVRDLITGFSGIVTGVCSYISGCHQALVVPPVDKDGKMVDGLWFDIQRLEVVTGDRIVLNNGLTPGPDSPPPRAF